MIPTHNSLVHARFSSASQSYQTHAKVQQEIGKRLCERFDYYTITPTQVLDLGAGPGVFSQALKKRFATARITAFDLSTDMLSHLKSTWRRPIHKVAGDMQRLPFKTNAFDVVFSNQVIHWANDCAQLFKEIERVLTPSGVFVFFYARTRYV